MAENQSDQEVLQHLNDDEAMRRAPVIAYIGLVAILGFIGNVHVLVVFSFYYKSSNFRCFVLCLAAVDTLSCVLAMPFEIFDMRYPFTFLASDVCSAFRYINTVLAACSVTILVVIAAERFRKICRPFKSQLTVGWAKAACAATVMLSILFCIPAALKNGNSTIVLRGNITGHDCGTKDSVRGTSLPIVAAVMILLSTFTAMISLIIMYTCIWVHLSRNNARLLRHRSDSTTTSKADHLNVDNSLSSKPDHHITDQVRNSNAIESSDLSEGAARTNQKTAIPEEGSENNSQEMTTVRMRKVPKVPQKYVSKTTLMFFLLTAIFIVTFLPHVALAFVIVFDRDFESNLTETEDAVSRIGMRLYFLNNAANPIVYGIYSNQFRNHCKQFYRRLFCLKQ